MRELKHRIWDTEAKCYIKEPTLIDNIGEIFIVREEVSPIYGTCLISHKPNAVAERCTGLKDKNGKEIYEGDIIDDGVSHIGKVFFNKRISAYVFEFVVDDNIVGSTFIELYTSDIEIIGNIHENAELLG